MTGEYIGIGRFQRLYAGIYLPDGGDDRPPGARRLVGKCCLQHDRQQPVYVEDVSGHFWAEVDYIEDYERILEHRGVEKIVR